MPKLSLLFGHTAYFWSVVSSINVSTHDSCGGINLSVIKINVQSDVYIMICLLITSLCVRGILLILEGEAIPCVSLAEVFSLMFTGVHELKHAYS
jgi:hypothetical protein